MKSAIIKHSVVIGGHKTSVSLEDAFWKQLKEIAVTENVPLSQIIAKIDSTRECSNLSSAIRVFVLEILRTKASASNTRQPSKIEPVDFSAI